MEKKENILKGAGCLIIAAFSYACMAALVKYISHDVGDNEILFMRYVVGLLLVLPVIFLPHRKPLSTKFFTNHLIRGVAALLTLYCFFYSIHHILLADAVLLNNTMPIFVPFVLYFWVGEKIPKKIIFPLIISFLGVILILRPGENLIHFASFVALASGLLMAISTCGIRILGKEEPTYRIMFYTFTIGGFLTTIPLFWNWQSITLTQLGVLVAVGLFGAAYQYFISTGYRLASPTKISPLIYLAVILSGLFDWIFWNQVPKMLSYFGIALVIIGAYLCMKVESKSEDVV